MTKLTQAVICLMLFMVSATGVWALSYEFEFNQTALQVDHDQYGDLLRLENCDMSGAPGDPFMPIKTGHIAAPFGTQITDIIVLGEEWVLLPGKYDIRPAPTPIPISYNGPMPEVVRNEAVYISDNPYPPEAFVFTNSGMIRGYSLGGFIIYPLKYYPASGRVEILKRMDVQVEYTASTTSFSPSVEFGSVVSRLVENSSDVLTQPFILSPVNPNDVRYLIITSSSLVSSFQPLADWYTQSGLPAEIVTYSFIQGNYSGATNQLKIKACIEDYADNKTTYFVLLGGDDTIIPDQNCWGSVNGGDYTDNTIPTDLFYACHNNTFNWNLDGDSYVGEQNDGIDLYPEVFLSRAPIRTSTQVTYFVNKTLNYIKNQPASGFNDPMLISGLELWNTWDSRSDADWRCEKMWNDYISPYWSGHSRVRFYDTNTDFGGSGHDVTVSNLSAKFNDGYNHFFMATHGGQTSWGMEVGGGFYSSNALSLTNNGHQGIVYTMACNTNAFEQDRYTSDPCLSEGFIRNGNGGAVAYQGSSRYGWGWGNESDNHGPSFQYADEFYYYMFTGNTTGVPIGYPYRMGVVAASHKADRAPQCYSEDDYDAVMRWLNYSLNSVGDPGIDLYTEEPTAMNPSYDDIINVGNSSYNVSNLPNSANVCLWKGSEVYAVGRAVSGGVTLAINPTSTGYMYITVTAHNYWPYIDSIEVVSTTTPYVVYDSLHIDDSSGNNDGLVNNGESIILGVQLKNVGQGDALNTFAVLSSSDSYITITDSTESYGTISGYNGVSYNASAFAFDVAGNIPDTHSILFELTVTGDARDTWISEFYIVAHAPVIGVLTVVVDDASGNTNGILDPGETADLIVTLENDGSALAVSVAGTISESDPFLDINDSNSAFGSIAANGGTADNSADVFTVTASLGCLPGHNVTFDLAVSAGGGYSSSLNFDVVVGDKMVIYFDDFSSNQGWTGLGGNGEWTIGPAVGGSGGDGYGGPDPAVDHSPGSDNQVLGNDLTSGTGGDYSANLSTTYWVTSPVIDCSEYSEVSLNFYRWLGIEQDLYDHVSLQVYKNSLWTTIFENPSSTIDESSWNEMNYDVSSYADSNASFQFRFGIGATDGGWEYCGWNIDDLALKGYFQPFEEPEISLSPNSIVDSLSPDYQSVHTVTIFNTGTGALNVTFTSADSWMLFDGGPYYVDPQDSVDLEVTLNAEELAPNHYFGSIDFSCNDPVTPYGSIIVSLYVYNPNIYISPAAITDTLREGQMTTRYIVVENTTEGVLDYTVEFQTFGLLGIDNDTLPPKEAGKDMVSSRIDNSVEVKNIGIDKGVSDGLILDIKDEWLDVTPLGGLLNAGEIDSLEVTLNAAALIMGIYTGQVSIASNDYDTPNIDIPVTLVVEEMPTPEIDLWPTSITDSLHRDDLSVHGITIYNYGDTTLSVSFTADESWLGFSGGPYYVEPTDSAILEVTLNAASLAPGNYTDSIDFTSNDPEMPAGYIPVSLYVYNPEISVDPLTITDTLASTEIETRYIIVQNTDDGILDYTVSVQIFNVLFNNRQQPIPVRSSNDTSPKDNGTNDGLILDITDDWLSVTPPSGSLIAGEIDSLKVTLNAIGLTEGIYTGQISLTSNDYYNPVVPVNITLHVTVDQGYAYLPGDANMYNGAWPPAVVGGDATYLVNYFRGIEASLPCYLDDFWASSDANGDCSVIGSDVTRLVNYFRGFSEIDYCPDYEPLWLSPTDLPAEAPGGWPNCDTPVLLDDNPVIPAKTSE